MTNVFEATRAVGARAPQQQPRPAFRCVAHDCPMPGAIFTSGARDGICTWHYGATPRDFPRITQLLHDWACVTDEILNARRELCGQATCMDAAREPVERAWERLRPALRSGPWLDELRPRDGEWL